MQFHSYILIHTEQGRNQAMDWTTPDLYDAYGDSIQTLLPLLDHFGGQTEFFGEIVTVKCFEDNSVVKEQAHQPGEGRVMVVDGGGSLRCALMGDQIAQTAMENGWAGVLIHGCVRDVEIMMEMDWGIMAMAAIPRKSTRRGEGQLNIPVQFGEVNFRPGDWMYADLNGVVVSERHLLE